jgi:hypothetical protein
VSEGEPDDSWKLKLRYGRLETPFTHYTAIAEGIVGQLVDGFFCRPGPAFMGIKTWAESADESADMARVIGSDIGFTVTGRIQVYETEPVQPPGEKPRGYDITFTPYDSNT